MVGDIPTMSVGEVQPTDYLGIAKIDADAREALSDTEYKGVGPHGVFSAEPTFKPEPLVDRDINHPSNKYVLKEIFDAWSESLSPEDKQLIAEGQKRRPKATFAEVDRIVKQIAVDSFNYTDSNNPRSFDPIAREANIEKYRRSRELLTTGYTPQVANALNWIEKGSDPEKWAPTTRAFFANPDNIKYVNDSEREAFVFVHRRLMDAGYEGFWFGRELSKSLGGIKGGFDMMQGGSMSFLSRSAGIALETLDGWVNEEEEGSSLKNAADWFEGVASDWDEFSRSAATRRPLSTIASFDPDAINPLSAEGLISHLDALSQGLGSLIAFAFPGRGVGRARAAVEAQSVFGKASSWLKANSITAFRAGTSEAGLFYGDTFRNLVEQGVDPKNAKSIAYNHSLGYGLAAGLLEAYGLDVIKDKMTPFLSAQTFRRRFMRVFVAAAAEGGTESLQFVAEVFGKGMADMSAGLEDTENIKRMGNLWKTMQSKEGVLSFTTGAILGGSPVAMGVTAELLGPNPRPFMNARHLGQKDRFRAVVSDPMYKPLVEALISSTSEDISRSQVEPFIYEFHRMNASDRKNFVRDLAEAYEAQYGEVTAPTTEEPEAPEAPEPETPEPETPETPEAPEPEAPEPEAPEGETPEPEAPEPEAPEAPKPEEPKEPEPEPEVEEIMNPDDFRPTSEIIRDYTDEQLDRLNKNPRGLGSPAIHAIQDEIADRKKEAEDKAKPEPETPEPEAPTPEAPTPEAPTPEAPEPEAPEPKQPTPSPEPETPTPTAEPKKGLGYPELDLNPDRERSVKQREQIDKQQADVLTLGTNLGANYGLDEVPMVRSLGLLESIDPRLVQGVTIDTVLKPMDRTRGTIGFAFYKATEEKIAFTEATIDDLSKTRSGRLFDLNDPVEVADFIDQTMSHEIAHALTLKRQKFDPAYQAIETRLFKAFRTESQRRGFITALREAGGMPKFDGPVQQVEFGNEVVNTIIMGHLTPDAIEKAAEEYSKKGVGLAVAEMVIDLVNRFIDQFTKFLNTIYRRDTGTGETFGQRVRREKSRIKSKEYDPVFDAMNLAAMALTFDEALDKKFRQAAGRPAREKIEEGTKAEPGKRKKAPAPAEPEDFIPPGSDLADYYDDMTADEQGDFLAADSEEELEKLRKKINGRVRAENGGEELPTPEPDSDDTSEPPAAFRSGIVNDSDLEKIGSNIVAWAPEIDTGTHFAGYRRGGVYKGIKVQTLERGEFEVDIEYGFEVVVTPKGNASPHLLTLTIKGKDFHAEQSSNVFGMDGVIRIADKTLDKEALQSLVIRALHNNALAKPLKPAEFDAFREEHAIRAFYIARNGFVDAMVNGKRLNIDDIYKMITGGTRAKFKDGSARTRDSQKFIETIAERAFNDLFAAAIADTAALKTIDPNEIAKYMVDQASMMQSIVTNLATPQTRRKSQAFSTPPAIALLAQMYGLNAQAALQRLELAAAMIEGPTRGVESSPVFEPQFGTGSLISLFTGQVFGNEDGYYRMLTSRLGGIRIGKAIRRDSVMGAAGERYSYTHEGAFLKTLREPGKSPATVMMLNPPFGAVHADSVQAPMEFPVGLNAPAKLKAGSVVKRTARTLEDSQIAEAMMQLPEGGVGVFIMGAKGGPKFTDESRQKAFNNWTMLKLLRTHNVIAHYSFSGEMYKQFGTSYPVDMIVVQKRTKESTGQIRSDLIQTTSQGPPTDLIPNIIENLGDVQEALRLPLRDFSNELGSLGSSLQRYFGELRERRSGLVPGGAGVEAIGIPSRTGDDATGEAKAKPGKPRKPRRDRDDAGGAGGRRDKRRRDTGTDSGTDAGKGAGRTPGGPGTSPTIDEGNNEPPVDPNGPIVGPKDNDGKPSIDQSDIDDLLDDFDRAGPLDDVYMELNPQQKRKASDFVVKYINQGITRFRDFVAGLAESWKGGFAGMMDALQNKKALAAALDWAWDSAVKKLGKVKNVKPAQRDIISEAQLIDPNRAGKPDPVTGEVIDPTDIQASYYPQSVRTSPDSKLKPADTLAPINQRDAIIANLVDIEERKGMPVAEYVAQELGMTMDELAVAFHGEQVDALAGAINATELGQGFVIADQTGVGKGRFVAGMLLYAYNKGYVPIFVTQKRNLYTDMMRDLIGIQKALQENGKPVRHELLMTNQNKDEIARPIDEVTGESFDFLLSDWPMPTEEQPKAPKISEKFDMEFSKWVDSIANNPEAKLEARQMAGRVAKLIGIATTYDQLKGADSLLRRQNIERLINSDRGAFMVMDEAHEASGGFVGPPKGEVTGVGPWFYQKVLFNKNLKGAIFSSATFAKRPDTLPIFTKAGLSHLTFDGLNDIVKILRDGGVQMISAFSQMMTEGGFATRRQKSFEGIDFDIEKYDVDEQRADDVAKVIGQVLALGLDQRLAQAHQNKMAEIAATYGVGVEKRPGKPYASVRGASESWTSIIYILAQQYATAMKAEGSAQAIIDALKGGELVMLGIEQTNEAALKDYLEDIGFENDDFGKAEIKFSFADMVLMRLKNFRKGTFKIKQGNQVIEEEEFKLTDADLKAVGLLEIWNQLMESIANQQTLLEIPAMAVDNMLEKVRKAGFKTGEITARNYRIKPVDDSGTSIIVERRSQQEIANRTGTVRDFNNDRIQLVLVNAAGTTGISLHAFKGVSPKPRLGYILQPFGDVAAFIQLLGRINRYGQIKVPRYTLATTNQPFELKLIGAIQRKMKTLNAGTTAESRSAVEFDSPDLNDVLGDIAVYEYLTENPQMAAAMAIKGVSEPSLNRFASAGKMVNSVLNRIVILPMAQQEEIIEEIETRREEIAETFKAQGVNPLAAPIRDYQMRTVANMDILPQTGPTAFEGGASLEKVEVNVLRTPPTSSSIADRIAAVWGDAMRKKTDPDDYVWTVPKPDDLQDSDDFRGGRDLRKSWGRVASETFRERLELWNKEAQNSAQDLRSEIARNEDQIAAQRQPFIDAQLRDPSVEVPPDSAFQPFYDDMLAAQRKLAKLSRTAQIFKSFSDLPTRPHAVREGGKTREEGFLLFGMAFEIGRGKQRDDAGLGFIISINITSVDAGDNIFDDPSNMQIELVGDQLGFTTLNGRSLRAGIEEINNEVDMYITPYGVGKDEFNEAFSEAGVSARELILVGRGNLIRIMSEFPEARGSVEFATKIDGGTERVLVLRNNVVNDFQPTSMTITSEMFAKIILGDGMNAPFYDFELRGKNAKGADVDLGRITKANDREIEVLVRSSARKHVEKLEEWGAANNLGVTGSARSTRVIVPFAQIKPRPVMDEEGNLIDPFIDELTSGPQAGTPEQLLKQLAEVVRDSKMRITVESKNLDSFQSATGLGEMTVPEDMKVSEAAETKFAKQQQRVRRNRKDRRRRGFVSLPFLSPKGAERKPSLVSKMLFDRRHRNPRKDTIPETRFASIVDYVADGEFMKWLMGNPVYSRALTAMTDAFDKYSFDTQRNLRLDQDVWQNMPDDYRDPEDTRFYRIMDEELPPWVVKGPDISTEEMDKLEWSEEKREAYRMIRDAPAAVQSAFIHFRARDEQMRKAMARAIQKQRIAMLRRLSRKALVDRANAEGMELGWVYYRDKLGTYIVDKRGKYLSDKDAIRKLAMKEIPTAKWGLRHAHVFHAWTGEYLVQWRKVLEKKPDGTIVWSDWQSIYDDGIIRTVNRADAEGGQRTEADALKAKQNWLKTHGDHDVRIVPNVVIPTDILRLTDKQFYRVKSNLRAFGDIRDKEISDVLKGAVGRKQYQQKFYASFLKREGVKGYTRDYWEVWRSSVVGFHRWNELTKANRIVQPAIERLRDSGKHDAANNLAERFDFLWTGSIPTGLAKSVDDALDSALDLILLGKEGTAWTGLAAGHLTRKNATKIQTLVRQGLYATQLAFNIRGALVNATQIPVVVSAKLGYFRTARAMVDLVAGQATGRNKSLLEQYGFFTGRGAWDDGYTTTIGGRASTLWNAIMDKSPFNLVEKKNQNGTFLIGMYDAMNRGYTEEEAVIFARDLRLETQFPYNAAAIGKIWRTNFGRTLFQFKRYVAGLMLFLVRHAATSGQRGVAARLFTNTVLAGGLRVILPGQLLSLVTGYNINHEIYEAVVNMIQKLYQLATGDADEDEAKRIIREDIEAFRAKGQGAKMHPQTRGGIEALADFIVYGVTAVPFGGNLTASDSFSPYPVNLPQNVAPGDYVESAAGAVFDLVTGVPGSTGINFLEELNRPIGESFGGLTATAIGRQFEAVVSAINGETNRYSRRGNLNFRRDTDSAIAAAFNFRDVDDMKKMEMYKSLQYAVAREREMINGYAERLYVGIIGNAGDMEAMRDAVEAIASDVERDIERQGANTDPEKVGLYLAEYQERIAKRYENIRKARGTELLLRSVIDANDATAARWIESLSPVGQRLIFNAIREDINDPQSTYK